MSQRDDRTKHSSALEGSMAELLLLHEVPMSKGYLPQSCPLMLHSPTGMVGPEGC